MEPILSISTNLYQYVYIFNKKCKKKKGRGIKNKQCEDYKINHWNVRKHLIELFTLPPLPLFLWHVTTTSNLFSFPHSGHREDVALHEHLYLVHSSHLSPCRPAEADGFSMVLINLHPSTSQVMDLSSLHIFEERKSYFLISRFGDGRKWKKCTGFAVQVEINPVFLRNFIFFRINTDMRSIALRSHWEHWTFLKADFRVWNLASPKGLIVWVVAVPMWQDWV